MLDMCGKIFVECKPEERESISKSTMDFFAEMYAGCSGYDFVDINDETKQTIINMTAKDFCEIETTNTGIEISLIDWYSAAEVITSEIDDSNSVYLGYGVEDEWSFPYPLQRILNEFPEVIISGAVSICGGFCEDMYETYKTVDSKIVAEPGICCTCCESIVSPDKAFFFDEELLDEMGTIGCCSRECAQQLLEEPSNDTLELLECYEDEIRELLEEEE